MPKIAIMYTGKLSEQLFLNEAHSHLSSKVAAAHATGTLAFSGKTVLSYYKR